MTYNGGFGTREGTGDAFGPLACGNAGVVQGAARLASVSCACAAARLCAALPDLADTVKTCQEVRGTHCIVFSFCLVSKAFGLGTIRFLLT